MRELHAGLLVSQGLPIILGGILALWIAYYIRAAVLELRAVRQNLEKLNYYFEAPDPHSAASGEKAAPAPSMTGPHEAAQAAIEVEARAK